MALLNHFFKMKSDLLDFLGNFINYLIFIYIFIKTINTSCFSPYDMIIALAGLILSVFIFIVSLINKQERYG